MGMRKRRGRSLGGRYGGEVAGRVLTAPSVIKLSATPMINRDAWGSEKCTVFAAGTSTSTSPCDK